MQTQSYKDMATGLEEFLLNSNPEHMTRQGIVGVILSTVVFVTVLITIPKIPVIGSAIASVAALGGVIYCGIGILTFMAVALIGCLLIVVANLQQAKAEEAADS